MVILDYCRLVALLIVGVIASITDIRNGKIQNKLCAFALAIGIFSAMVCYAILKSDQLNRYLLNTLILCGIGIIFYAVHVWAGGDAKLFCACAILYPEAFYWNFINSEFSLVYVTVIIFSFGFIFLLGDSIWLFTKEKKRFAMKDYLKKVLSGIKSYAVVVFFAAALGHIYEYAILPFINLPGIVFTFLCIGISVLAQSLGWLSIKWVSAGILLFDCAFAIFTQKIMLSNLWIDYLIILIILCLRIFIDNYNYQSIPTENVEMGMVLSRLSVIQMQKSRVTGLPESTDETLKSRLSSDQANSVRRWAKSKTGLEKVVIVRKIPFAIFILLGFISYFIAGQILL